MLNLGSNKLFIDTKKLASLKFDDLATEEVWSIIGTKIY